MHLSADVGIGSIMTMITILGSLVGFIRWGKKMLKFQELPEKLDKVNANLESIALVARSNHEQALLWQQRHIMEDHRPRRF